MYAFIMIVLAVTVAILLASGLSMFIMFKLMNNQKVIEWYFNWFTNYVAKFENLAEDMLEKDEA